MNQVPIYTLKRGQKFRIHCSVLVFTFERMDGMYCKAKCDETGEPLYWCGPVEVVE